MTTDATVYCNCMVEVRSRIALVESMRQGVTSLGNEIFDREMVFLQLRKVLEYIAFASIAANKTAYEAAYSKFATHWNAERMLRDLGEVNPGFYPVPVSATRDGDKGGHRFFRVDCTSGGFMTKQEFVFLYDKCAQFLHSWNPFNPADPIIKLQYSVHQWVERIQKLLAMHMVQLLDDRKWIITIPNEGPVHAAICAPVTS